MPRRAGHEKRGQPLWVGLAWIVSACREQLSALLWHAPIVQRCGSDAWHAIACNGLKILNRITGGAFFASDRIMRVIGTCSEQAGGHQRKQQGSKSVHYGSPVFRQGNGCLPKSTIGGLAYIHTDLEQKRWKKVD